MSTVLLPQAFWFRLSFPCLRVDDLPRTTAGRLLDLPDSCRLPRTSTLDGRESWAEVRTAWNPQGLAVSVTADGALAGLADDDRPEGAYGLQVWVDTRDTRDVSRATRFCHRFDVKLSRAGKKSELGATVEPRPIARAVADAPLCRPDAVRVSASRLKGTWRVELFFSAGAFHGFDPETNRRLGFAYRVFDPDRQDETPGVGREFPSGENPSLWSTLELRDEA